MLVTQSFILSPCPQITGTACFSVSSGKSQCIFQFFDPVKVEAGSNRGAVCLRQRCVHQIASNLAPSTSEQRASGMAGKIRLAEWWSLALAQSGWTNPCTWNGVKCNMLPLAFTTHHISSKHSYAMVIKCNTPVVHPGVEQHFGLALSRLSARVMSSAIISLEFR